MLIDLSHTLKNGMPCYPGMAPFALSPSRGRSKGERGEAAEFNFAAYAFPANTGTYIDAPHHRYAERTDIAALPLERIADLEAVVVAVPEEGGIGPEQLRGVEMTGRAVLLHTGWAKRWGGDYYRSGPFVSEEGARWLVENGAALCGIDCANIDDMTDAARPAHTILLDAGIAIVEHLCGLEQLKGRRKIRFFAVPPRVVGGTSFPVRAFAIAD
jgi:kynurenine formamidase